MTTRHAMPHLLIFSPALWAAASRKTDAISGRSRRSRLAAPPGADQRRIDSGSDAARRRLEHEPHDGVVPTELIADLHAVPKVVTQAGYGPFRKQIAAFFDVVEGSIHQPTDRANFYTFPYDWRRDNRATARRSGGFRCSSFRAGAPTVGT